MRLRNGLAFGLTVCQTASAIDLDTTSTTSIKDAANTIAWGMMHYYTGNNTGDVPGNLPSPYYWWEAGAMFGTMIEYWYYTNDTSYNQVVQDAILHQVGDNYDFMPGNQTKTEGNDDQGFWAMAALTAAETKFMDPPSGHAGWIALAQAVFELMVERWDTTVCGGGLRWQIFTFNTGYNYKNSIANGCFFNIASRLARYTGNATYADWAEKIFTWEQSAGLVSQDYHVYDGTQIASNCGTVDQVQWTYNLGVYLFGAAMMYDYTNASDTWKTRLDGLLSSSQVFFKDSVMSEIACETHGADASKGTCNNDQNSFKAYLSRWMAGTTRIVPYTRDTIMPYLSASASAAALQCDGTTNGLQSQCGAHWTAGSTNDGLFGVGQQMSALSVIQSLLIDQAPDLVTNVTGGTSKGSANLGSHDGGVDQDGVAESPVTTGGKAGAGLLTVGILVGVVGGCGFLILG